jgi:sensor histidine kinase regulating citrate/malate metabolism
LIHYGFEWGVRSWILQYDTVWNGQPNYTHPIFATCAVVVLFILYRIVLMVYFLFNGRELNMFGVFNFTVTIFYSGLFIYFILVVRNYVYLFVDNQILILVLLLGLVMINAYALSYGTSLSQNSILRYRLRKAEEKNQLTYEYYKNMENQIHECRSILHDVKNHVQVLEGMYHSGNLGIANEYAGTLAGEIEAIYPRCYSSNKMVDIILQDKEKKALQSNTRIHYEVEDVDWGFMSDYHLSTILCNLFDNAITGCTKLPEDMREITCKIRKVNGFLILKMSNPIDPVHVKEMEKKNLKHRLKTGTGLCNVRKVVGLYEGEFSTVINDNLFAVSVSFSI